jgi:hypothetical protein
MATRSKWLFTIKQNIQNKYNITNPIFIADPAALQDKDLNSWLEKSINPNYPFYWLKYKRIVDSTFELKPFLPNPDENLATNIINDFLTSIDYVDEKTYFTVNKFVYVLNSNTNQYDLKDVPGETYYNLPEIKVELGVLVRKGFSKITLEKQSMLEDGKIIYHLHVGQDSIENMLVSGYLELEYKDE